LVVFDSKTIIDQATFQDPHQYPVGIEWVLVNGKMALENGVYKDLRSGEVLKKKIP